MRPGIEEVPFELPWVLKPVTPGKVTVASLLPAGFETYLRLFHPFAPWDWESSEPLPVDRRTRWHHLAGLAGVKYGSTTTWRQLEPVLPDTEHGRPYAVWEGTLELNTAEALLSNLDSVVGTGPLFVAFNLASIIRTTRQSPLMFSIESIDRWIEVTTDVVPWINRHDLCTPEYTWPEDQRWIICSDYDLSSTYIASSASTASQLFADPELEVLEVALTDRIDNHADEQANP